MLKDRLITAIILIPIVIVALFLLPLVEFTLLTWMVCVLSVWEWGALAGLVSNSQRIGLAIFFGFLLAIMLTMPACGGLFISMWKMQYVLWMALVWWLIALILVLAHPHSVVLWRDSRILRLLFGVLTIFPFFWSVLLLRQYQYDINHFAGSWLLLYVIVLVWGVDSGSYIFGKILGRHKLAPKVSPGKTWEGLIGGLITSVVMAWLFDRCAPVDVVPLVLFICSAVSALASVLGDLTESMLKREAGIKESSHLIPGHGGILDRIDSLTAAVPIFSCLMLLVFHAI